MNEQEYDKSFLGSVVIIKNIIFNQNKSSGNVVDHAWNLGRPCVIIYSDDVYDYFLPLSSSITKKDYYNKIKYRFFEFDESNFTFLQKSAKLGAINIETIYRKRISGYSREIGKLNKKSYIALLKKVEAYHRAPRKKILEKAIDTKKFN